MKNLNTENRSFDDLIAYYKSLQRTGEAAWIPDFVFTQNLWQFHKIQFPLTANDGKTNNLVFKQIGIKELQMALYIPITVGVKDGEKVIQRDFTLSDQLTVPLYRRGYNDNIFDKDRLIIGDKMIDCYKSCDDTPVTPVKMYCIGVNSCLANSVMDNLGGIESLLEKVGVRFLNTNPHTHNPL